MKCYKCNGTGIDDDRLICYECGGTGEYEPFDADVELDKLYPTELTNEEHLKSLDTEQFAEWIAKCIKDTIILTHGNRKYTDNIVSEKWWVEWLKQPHHESVTVCNE